MCDFHFQFRICLFLFFWDARLQNVLFKLRFVYFLQEKHCPSEGLIFESLGKCEVTGGSFGRSSRFLMRRVTPNVNPDLEFRIAS